MARLSLEERLNRIEDKISEKSFRENKGLGNEVGYYVFDYDPRAELEVRNHIAYLKDRINNGNKDFKIIEFDLFHTMIQVLDEEGYLEAFFDLEKDNGFFDMADSLVETLGLDETNELNLIISKILQEDLTDSVIFLTGVGKCHPIIASHNILNNLHQEADKEYILGTKELKKLRLSQDARMSLLDDFKRAKLPRNEINRSWRRWLESGEQLMEITFESKCWKENPSATLLSITHPLVKLAADYLQSKGKVVTSLRVESDQFAAGVYPFAIYQWKLSGEREDIQMTPVSSNTNLNRIYVNLRTDEDVIFQSGITDPFLVRVLNMRKKQHSLTDIFVTIQENQNKIVNTDFNKNIIVQGCAGSGKTMVLLHRLSALKYKQRYFDFSQNALILTPNEQFSLHIKGLAEGLQIGSVHRISVEQYYLDMLLQYDSAFKPENKIVSEMQVRQDYVDYIYSDQFKNDFERAYNDILEKRNGLVDILIQLQEAMNQEKKTISWTEESRFTIQMKYSVAEYDTESNKNQEANTNKKEHKTESKKRKSAALKWDGKKKLQKDEIVEKSSVQEFSEEREIFL